MQLCSQRPDVRGKLRVEREMEPCDKARQRVSEDRQGPEHAARPGNRPHGIMGRDNGFYQLISLYIFSFVITFI